MIASRLLWPGSLFLLIAFTAPPPSAASTGPGIVFSHDIQGELEPCGCRGTPQGGFARRANWLKMKQAQNPGPLLWVDTGDLLFATSVLPKALEPQARAAAEQILAIFAQAPHKLLLPGEKDLALGLETYRQWTQKAAVPVIAANLTARGQAPFPPYWIWHDTAFIGVVSPDMGWPEPVRVSSPTIAIQKTLQVLPPKVKQVILLSHLGLEADRKIARRFKNRFAWIIGAHSQSFLQEPVRIGKTLIGQTSFRNQAVGYIALHASGKSAIEHYELVALDSRYQGPSSVDADLARLQERLKELQNQLESELPTNAPQTGTFQTFPACAQCHIPQFAFWSRTRHAEALTPLAKEHQAANLDCLSCHSAGIASQDQANALTRLKDQPTPLSLEQTESFLDRVRKSAWDSPHFKLLPTDPEDLPLSRHLARIATAHAPVQCENCHGPGGNHPFGGSIRRSVNTQTCLQCHTRERAPSWYDGQGKPDVNLIDSKLKAVQCPVSQVPDASSSH